MCSQRPITAATKVMKNDVSYEVKKKVANFIRINK